MYEDVLIHKGELVMKSCFVRRVYNGICKCDKVVIGFVEQG